MSVFRVKRTHFYTNNIIATNFSCTLTRRALIGPVYNLCYSNSCHKFYNILYSWTVIRLCIVGVMKTIGFEFIFLRDQKDILFKQYIIMTMLRSPWIFLDSERSDECIDFTMMCVFFLFFHLFIFFFFWGFCHFF